MSPSTGRLRPVSPLHAGTERQRALAELERSLAQVLRLTRARVHRRALQGTVVDLAGYATLAALRERGCCRLGELAAHLGVDVSTTSRQVGALELAGLIERRSDPSDQRARLLSLRPEGENLLDRARLACEQQVDELLASWGDDDLLGLARLLGRLAEEMATTEAPAEVEAVR